MGGEIQLRPFWAEEFFMAVKPLTRLISDAALPPGCPLLVERGLAVCSMTYLMRDSSFAQSRQIPSHRVNASSAWTLDWS